MNRYVIYSLLIIVVFSSCYENKNKAEFLIVNIEETISDSVVVKLNDGEFISKAIVRMIGEVDGSYIFNEHIYEKGFIDSIIYSHDWYQPIYRIEYQPLAAKSGHLKIIVEFL